MSSDLRTVLPPRVAERVVDQRTALDEAVVSGVRLGSGLGTSEPHSFYATLWDHIRAHGLTDLTIKQALFMAPHPVLVGDDLARHLETELSGEQPPRWSRVGRFLDPVSDLPAVGDAASSAADLLDEFGQLRSLIDHLEELEDRGIRFVSGFLGPVTNTVIPDHPAVRVAFPEWAGRNRARSAVTRMHPVHFPDAADALVHDAAGNLAVDLFVTVMTPPRDGELSFGLSNGANGDAMEVALTHPDAGILLYVNAAYPFTEGFPGGPNTVAVERLERPAREGRLWIVEDDGPLPGLPPGSFDDPSEDEKKIGALVADHITSHPELTTGRALQVGIGGTGVQAIEQLRGSSWRGRIYTEMLEPFTYGLLEAGNATGSHYLGSDGRRHEVDDRVVCTFMVAEDGDDFYHRPEVAEAVLMGPATRVLLPEAFRGGLGINNVLGIDFNGHVNVSGRDKNPWSGIGGSGVIHRGLAVGGVAYLCMRSTHSTPDGERRSSIFPWLPQGTPVSLVGPDLMGTRDGAAFFLVTEHGVAQLNRRSQDDFVRALISVSHPDFRDELASAAWDELRIPV